MHTLSRIGRIVALVVILAALLGGCAPKPAAPTPAPAATSPTEAPPATPTTAPTVESPTVASPAAPTDEQQTLTIGLGRNLYDGPATWYFLHGSLGVWEPLIILDNDMMAQPVLATSWEMEPDGKVWTITLRQGVTFHDGTPFDAEAVLLNIPKLQEEYMTSLPHLATLEKVDDHTVRFVMDEPTPNLPQLIAYFSSAMLAPSAVGDDGRPTAPIGTGPFVFVDYIKDDAIILERNENYWGERPHLSQVTFKYIPDANTRLAALQSGQIDAIADVGALQPEQAPVIQQDPNLVLLEQGVATTHYLTFNSGKPPFDDMRLRQALNMAIDRQALVDSTLYGYGQPGMSVLTPHAVQWLHPDVAPRYDAATAQQLAQDALDGQRVEAKMLISSALIGRWPYENIAQIVQAIAIPLGIDITIEVVEAGAWNTALREGDYHLTMMPYTLMTGDPDFFMRRWVWSQGDMNQRRSYGYANPRADELAVAAVSETDLATRKAMYDELQEIVAEEVPFTPLYHEVTIYATRNDVHDLLLDVQFKPSLERAYRGQ